MNEDVKWLTPNEALINGWVFNFRMMRAMRNKWVVDLETGGLEYTRKKSYDYKIEKDMVNLAVKDGSVCSVRTWAPGGIDHGTEYGRMDGYKQQRWFSFFTEPEDRYNAVINEAYATWCLERAIENA